MSGFLFGRFMPRGDIGAIKKGHFFVLFAFVLILEDNGEKHTNHKGICSKDVP